MLNVQNVNIAGLIHTHLAVLYSYYSVRHADLITQIYSIIIIFATAATDVHYAGLG